MNALRRVWDNFEEGFIAFLLAAMTLVTFVYGIGLASKVLAVVMLSLPVIAINSIQPAAFKRTGKLVEIPPRHAVLTGHDRGIRAQ